MKKKEYTPTVKIGNQLFPAEAVSIKSQHAKPEWDFIIGGGTPQPQPWNGWFGYYYQDPDQDLDFQLFKDGEPTDQWLYEYKVHALSLKFQQIWGISYGGWYVLLEEPLPDASLTEKEVGHPGCGAGTDNACFALTLGPGGMQCALISNPQIAQIAGVKLGWRVNVDPTNNRAWCPKEVLANSKKPHDRPEDAVAEIA